MGSAGRVDAFSSDQQALAFFAQLSPSSIRMGLESTRHALEKLQNPERKFRSVHIAGTNGKGSTCAFIERCLRAEGFKVGLFTSPHLLRVNERIKVDGQDIEDAALADRIREVITRCPEIGLDPPLLTYFEFGTVLAFWHFLHEKVDVAVIETGLGGRLDSTSTVHPAVTTLTPISFDHMEYLGHSLQQISFEKAGILKSRTPAVTAKQPLEALAVIENTAAQLGISLRIEGRDFSSSGDPSGGFDYQSPRHSLFSLFTQLQGEHQFQNAGVAIATLELLEEGGVKVSTDSIRSGLAETRWPGRFEVIHQLPLTILDGAHNAAGVKVLVAALKKYYPNVPYHLVFGVLKDKEYQAMAQSLFPICASVQIAPVGSDRSLAPESYQAEMLAWCPRTSRHASVADALSAARRFALDDSGVVVCAGSLVLIGQLKHLFSQMTPKPLG